MNSESRTYDRRWLILAILALAQLMVVLDATVVNVALPSAQKALGFSNDNRQWIVTAYSLAFGSLLLLGGKVSDVFGRKWTFIIGLAGFAIASAVGGAAQSFIMLAVARAFQGGFGALLAPAALSLLTTTFTDPGERNKAFGIYGAIAGAGASVGLLLGGVLTQYLNWRYCMFVNLLFAAVTIAGGLTLLTHHALDDQAAGRRARRGDDHARAVRPRVRLQPRRDRQLDQPADDRRVGRRRGAAGGLLRDRTARRRAAAAAAGRDRSQPRCLVLGDAARVGRDVRRVPVLDLLPAAHPGVFAGQDRLGVPADDRTDRDHLRPRADAADAAPRAADHGCDRDGGRRCRNGAAGADRRPHPLRQRDPARRCC